MSMRRQLVESTYEIMKTDDTVVTLLGDIGVFGFRHVMKEFGGQNGRIYNIGILEQATISVAAGLSLAGLNPVVHTIAPFIVERAYEQLKIDFCYQKLNGNFISVGASYDYAKLGSTHYCPGDVGALYQLPNMQIIIPGTSQEFQQLYLQGYNNGAPTYFRLSETENECCSDDKVQLGKASVIKLGNKGTIIAVGNVLDKVIEASQELDVTVLYYTTVKPFDHQTLIETTKKKNILLVEPYYYGVLSLPVLEAFRGSGVKMDYIGVPHEFLVNYGTLEQNDEYCGITVENIMNKMEQMIDE